MSIVTFPLNNTDYTADDMALYFSNRTNGVFSADTELSTISNNSMTITIKPGRAWLNVDTFKGYIFASNTDVNLTIATADGVLNRIDRVVIKYDVIANKSTLEIKRGTTNSNPIPPPLARDKAVAYELAIADIYVGKGITIIRPQDITDKRLDSSVCGLVSDGINKIATDVLNNQFQDWFVNLKNQLDSNQATNLQNQINTLKDSKIDKVSIVNDLNNNDPNKVLSGAAGNLIKIDLFDKAKRPTNFSITNNGFKVDRDTGLIEIEMSKLTAGINQGVATDVTFYFPIALPTQFSPQVTVYNNFNDKNNFIQYNVIGITAGNLTVRVRPTSYTDGIYINVRINGV